MALTRRMILHDNAEVRARAKSAEAQGTKLPASHTAKQLRKSGVPTSRIANLKKRGLLGKGGDPSRKRVKVKAHTRKAPTR